MSVIVSQSSLTSPPQFISPSAERQVNQPTALSQEETVSNTRGQGTPVIRAAVLPGLRRGQGHRSVHLKQVLPRQQQKSLTAAAPAGQKHLSMTIEFTYYTPCTHTEVQIVTLTLYFSPLHSEDLIQTSKLTLPQRKNPFSLNKSFSTCM